MLDVGTTAKWLKALWQPVTQSLSELPQDANEGLQAANEELMLTQEELQATNEELETNNEELQATNEELQTTNDELSSRTLELQEMTRQYRTEHLQLNALLERFPYYVMVLNAEDLTVHAVNPAYRQLLGERDVQPLQVDDLIKMLRTAVRESITLNTDPIVASVNGTHADTRFIHTIVPVSDAGSANVSRLFLYSEKVD